MNIIYLFNHQGEFHSVMSNIILFHCRLLQVIQAPTVYICPEVVLLQKYQLKSSFQVQFRYGKRNPCVFLQTNDNNYGIKILIFRMERFNDYGKTNTKVITLTNRNRSKQHSEPIQSEFLAIMFL